ncbi:hypothetical protein FOZ62_006604, partial [Perkinsus olseni]
VNAMEGKYYWKAMRRDVKHFFKQCPGCQRSRGLGAWVDTHPHINPRVHLAVNDALSIDWLGPVKDTVQGGELTTTTTAPQYCLHVSDPFSGANQFYVASDRTALTAVRLLEEHCWRFGWPYVISSDCDKAFQSKVFQSWCLANQLLHVTDPPYSAQRRAYLERVHAELWSCIRSLRLATSDGVTNSSRSSLRPWYTLLPMISHCLNSSAGDEEGAVSPHTLVFAYQVRGPPALEPRPRPERLRPFIEGHQDQKPFKITSEAIIGFRREQEELLRSYRDHLVRKVRQASIKFAERNVRRRQLDNIGLTKGTLLWVRAPSSSKLSPRWNGPVRVSEYVSGKQFVIVESLIGRPLGEVHLSNIRFAYLNEAQLREYTARESRSIEEAQADEKRTPSQPVPVHSSRRFPSLHYFYATTEDGKVELQRSLLPEGFTGPTDYWVGCDNCGVWTIVPKEVHDEYKDKDFTCGDIDCPCIAQLL